MGIAPSGEIPQRPTREQALAAAALKLQAKRREARRKSSLVLTVSVLAILVPVALFAGADLSSWFYPPEPAASEPTVPPGEVAAVSHGSRVSVRFTGTLDNGTAFADNATVIGTVGEGTFVQGVERALIGLAPGANFTVVVAPKDGYGNWSTSRTYHQEPNETVKRNTTMEVGNFDDRWGEPHVGQVVPTSPWPSTVASIGTKYVYMQSTPVVGETVRYHKYWDSKVVSFNHSHIKIENLIWIGYTYSRVSSETGNTLTYIVTKLDSRGYLFDRNGPLAGKTLHYNGTVLAVEAGTGLWAGASPLLVTGSAVSIGTQRCERCHGAFAPFDASASAAFEGTGVRVNLTLQNPWRHDLTKVTLGLEALEGNQTVASAAEAAPDLAARQSDEVSVLLPDGPATEGLVRVVVNGNAHHVHGSAGRHDDNVYQMAFEIPIGGPGRVTAAAAGQVIAEIEKTPAELWGLIGQWAGAVALVAACLPATQGLKRHAGLKPRFKRIHYFLLTGFIFAGALHIVASSTTLRWLVGA